MRILIVEDEVRLRVSLVRVLSRRAFVMEQAATVAEAKKLLAERSYDAVLLDWQLPDGSGLDLCKAIRASKISDVHVIMFTGRVEHSDRLRAFDAGVDDYVVKDVDIEEIAARLKAVARRRGLPTTLPV